MKNKKNPGMVYGILGGVIVLLVAAVAVLATTLYSDRNRASADGSGTQAAAEGTAAPAEEETEGGGMYAEYTEPTEKPIDIYYVENNFDAEACDIKPAVSEEGWYIENVGCLEGVKTTDGDIYDESRIRKFENHVFEQLRERNAAEWDENIGRLTIDTRTLMTEESYRPVFVSVNCGRCAGLLVYDMSEGYIATFTEILVEPIIHENRDYFINLDYLRQNENTRWDDEMLVNFQKSFFKYTEQEKLQVGMCVIDYDTITSSSEDSKEPRYKFDMYVYGVDDLMIEVRYNINENKWKFTAF